MARATPAVVWIETPTNPRSTSSTSKPSPSSHTRAARCVVVDNTFATPVPATPLALGADIVVHSATKYLGGHSDVVGGFVAHRDDDLAEGVAFVQNAAGAVPSPFDCYLVLRGVKTLAVRMDRHCDNARAIVGPPRRPSGRRARPVPGLPDHPGHAVAKRQMRDFGGMVSLHVRGGEAAALEVVRRTKVFTLAESLGAVESPHRASGAHDARVGRRLAARGRSRAGPPVRRHRDRRPISSPTWSKRSALDAM